MVTLVCISTHGDYPITFMWTGPDDNMLDMMIISSNNYSSEVTISTTETSVFGKYTCLATNSFGSSNGTLTIVQASKKRYKIIIMVVHLMFFLIWGCSLLIKLACIVCTVVCSFFFLF